MNKIKMVRNIKENNKKDSFEKEIGWNNRVNTAEKSPLMKNHQAEIPTVIKPTNLRQASSKLKIKTETSHLRIKSASKSINSNKPLLSPSNTNHQIQTPNNKLAKDPAYIQITTLWDALGVTSNYRRIFDNVSIQLASVYREGYFSNELAQIQKINDYVKGLQKDISSRQKIIELLKKFDRYISLNSNMQTNQQLPEKVLIDIINTIKDLRVVSIRIVDMFIKIRKNISYDVLCGKFDIDKINDYNKSYMITMKNDTDFLSVSNLSNYFNFASESDPFLTSLSETVSKGNNNNTLNQVPIDDDMVESIKNCQYVLLREMINYESIKLFPQLESCISTPSLKSNKRIMNVSVNEIFMTQKKKNIHQIRIKTKSPEYSRINRANHNKEYIIAGKMPPLKYEDSKLSEKKYSDSKSSSNINTDGYLSYIGKTQGNECLETGDLIKIDEIINRSIKQKREIDEKDIQTPNKERDQIREINQIISNEQNKDLKQREQQRVMTSKNENKDIRKKPDVNEKNKEKTNDLNQNHNEGAAHNQLKASDRNKELTSNNKDVKANKVIENNDEIVENIAQHEYDGYYFKFFTGAFNELSKMYSSYIAQIHEDQVIAFNLSMTIDNYLTGIFPKIVIVQSNESSKTPIIQGLITLSYDNSSQDVLKLNIMSISSMDNEKLSNVLLAFFKFSNDNLSYDEMHIEFFYGIKEGQFYLNKSIEDILKSKAKFKWVNMENDGKIRKINYKYVNPSLLMSRDSPLKMPTNAKDLIVNALKMKSCSLISLERKGNDDSRDEALIMKGGENEVNDFALMCLFGEMISRYDYSIDLPLLNGIKIDKLRKLSKDFLFTQIGVGSEISDFIQTSLSCVYNKIQSSMLNEYFLCGSLMRIDHAFENIASTVISGIIYNRLNLENIEVFSLKKECTITDEEDEDKEKEKGKNEKFYLVHTTNENCSLLIYEIVPNGSFNDLLDNNTNEGNQLRIFQAFKNVYYKIDQQPNETKNTIYLPSFSITQDNYLLQPRSFANTSISNEDCEYKLGKLNQFETFAIGGDSKEGLITFDVHEEDIVIKSDFLIAVINHDLLCDLQIPTIAAYIVKKDNWIKG